MLLEHDSFLGFTIKVHIIAGETNPCWRDPAIVNDSGLMKSMPAGNGALIWLDATHLVEHKI